jgi:uncharacterized OB-fold protein
VSVPLPLPAVDADTKPFWDAAREGELRIQRCRACGRHQFYPRRRCTACGGDVEWVTSRGEGRVYSYTVVHRAAHESLLSLAPYVVALVDLDEGVRMMTRLRHASPDGVRIGQPVRVVFERLTDEVTLPLFEVKT